MRVPVVDASSLKLVLLDGDDHGLTTRDDTCPAGIGRLRLQVPITPCLFDLDGVLTRTAELHVNGLRRRRNELVLGLMSRHGVAVYAGSVRFLAAVREAARRLGVAPGQAAVLEDALAGVAAGRAGGLAVGIDRAGRRAAELRASGAEVVVSDVAT